MMVLLTSFLAFLAPASWATSLASRPTTIHLAPGQAREISLPSSAEVRIANGGLVKAVAEGARLQVLGKKMGSTSLLIKSSSGTYQMEVRIHNNDIYRQVRTVESELSKMRGLELDVVNGVIHINGRLLRWNDWLALSERQKLRRANLRFLAEFDAVIEAEALNYFRGKLKDSYLPQTTIQMRPHPHVRYSGKDPETLANLKEMFSPFGLPIDSSDNTIGDTALVKTTLLISELNRKARQILGVDWPTSVGVRTGDIARSVEDLQVAIHALESSGEGRLLATPQLLSRVSNEAEFHSGGEIPIIMRTLNGREVIWKKYGIIIRAKPQLNQRKQVRIAIAAEISSPDYRNLIDGQPGLTTSRIQSEVDLLSGKSLAIGGLIRNESGQGQSGLRGLSQIPLFGLLFSSEDFIESRSELYIFICPQLVEVDG